MLVEINLLGEKERDRPAFVVAAISLILLGLVAGLVFYFLGNSFEKKQQVLASQSAEVVSQQTFIQGQLQTTAALNDTQKLQKTVEWAETYQYDTLPLIRELTSLLPERGFFMNFTFDSPSIVTLDVQFDTTREAAFYLTQLKSSEMVTDVTLSNVMYQPLTEELEEQGEDTITAAEPETPEMPRYVASYSITFLDTRMPAEGTAVPADPNAPPVEEEAPTEEESSTNEVIEELPVETPETESQAPSEDTEGADLNE